MSVHTRKHHIHEAATLYVIDNSIAYAIPKQVAKQYIVTFKKTSHNSGTISANDVFAELDKKYTKAGALLQGVRARENLSQVEFAKRINVTQANLSKMENGRRPIGQRVAKRIEKAFGVNYRYFL